MTNKKGFTVLGMIASFAIFALIVITLVNFKEYIANHKSTVIANRNFNVNVESEIALIYEDWNYEGKVFLINGSDFSVEKLNLGATEYNTVKMKVDFKYKDFSKSVELERSQHNDE